MLLCFAFPFLNPFSLCRLHSVHMAGVYVSVLLIFLRFEGVLVMNRERQREEAVEDKENKRGQD